MAFLLRHLLFLLLFQGIAFWPIWRWLLARLNDSPDDRWGLLALATFLLLCCRSSLRLPLYWRRQRAISGMLLLYALMFPFLPNMLLAVIALLTVGLTLNRFPWQQGGLSMWGLLILALPLHHSLEFFMGYPLRVLVAELCQPLLQLSGFDVTREGVVLSWAGERLVIDAPCSGIRMLWTGIYLTYALAAFQKFNSLQALFAAMGTVIITILGNALRITLIFHGEMGMVSMPPWAHEGLGLMVFGGNVILILIGIRWIQQSKLQNYFISSSVA